MAPPKIDIYEKKLFIHEFFCVSQRKKIECNLLEVSQLDFNIFCLFDRFSFKVRSSISSLRQDSQTSIHFTSPNHNNNIQRVLKVRGNLNFFFYYFSFCSCGYSFCGYGRNWKTEEKGKNIKSTYHHTKKKQCENLKSS